MKKKKIGIIIATILTTIVTIISTLFLASTISVGGGDSEWTAIWTWELNYYTGTGSGHRYGFALNDNEVARRNNIYCIENGGVLRTGYAKLSGTNVDACRFYVRAIVELSNGKAKVKYYGSNDWDYHEPSWSDMDDLNSGEHNLILAAILYGDGDWDRGMWTGDGAGKNYTEQQKALYYYWNTWVSLSGFNSSYAHSSNPEQGSYSAYKKYEEQAKTTNYDLRMYVLKPSDNSDYQDLCVARRFGTSSREINIPVTKEWEDENNAYSNRPESITVDLYRDGSYYKSMTLSGSMTADNWTGTFSQLDPQYTYEVKEKTVPTGYTSQITGNQDSGYVITNWLDRTSLNVQKTWSDLDNCYDLRPASIKLKLMRQRVDESKGAEYIKDVTLESSSNWKGTISELPVYVEGYKVKHWVEEIEPENYTQNISYDSTTSTYKVVNSLDKLDIKVTKKWEDEENYYNNRPESVRVYLYIDNVKQEDKYIDLKGPDWTGTFTGLEPVEGYTVKEETPAGYASSVTGTVKEGFTITNTLERTSVAVEKIWDDENNALKLRPDTIIVSLWQDVNGIKSEFLNEDGEHLYKTLQGTDKSYPLKDTFTDLPKYIDGVEVDYLVKEEEDKNPGLFDNYMLKEEPIPYDKETNTFIITNVLSYDGYKEIKGRVWVDGRAGKANEINGKIDNGDTLLEGITVRLKYIDENGNHVPFNPEFPEAHVTTTDENGEYTIKVNYDNGREVYKLYEDIDTVEEKLKKSYVEFEYDGMLYTTISDDGTESLAEEDANQRAELDKKYSTVTAESQKLERIINDKNIAIEIKPADENRQITARTKTMKTDDFMNATTIKERESDEITLYCKGDGKYIRTNTTGAWLEPVQGTCSNCLGEEHTRTTKIDVEIIENVNLGLFEREQPEVAIFSDITTVEVEMNNQRYTYKYGVRSNQYNTNNESGLQTKFQNKDTYTYKRPVNPADVAYAKSVSEEVMQVYVTYEVKVGNLSTTLPMTVHNIINYFDSEYTLLTEGWTVTTDTGNDRYHKATYNGDINIRVEPQKESDAIILRYKVSQNAIKRLLEEEPPLNNAVEIESYSTEYGTKTLYAEQRTSEKEGNAGRAGNPYAGYSYGEHPGNVTPDKRISINSQGKIEIKNQENDEDIAPAFLLHMDEDDKRTLSGTVWEDENAAIETDEERLGNGYIDNTENSMENVKVELYNLDGTRADLYGYNETTDTVTRTDAVVGTNESGDYSFIGVVTGEYFIKYSYGDNLTATTKYYKKNSEGTPVEEEELELKDGTATKLVVDSSNKPTINARNYKSTIITDTKIKNIMGKSYEEFSTEEKNWPITHDDNYSVAVDNMLDRLAIGELKYGNYTTGENMIAFTKPFIAQIEFEITGESTVEQNISTDANGNKEVSGEIGITNSLSTLDFGIIERPREVLIVEKTITDFSVKLSNGQVLTGGDPRNDTDMNYTKAIGFNRTINSIQDAEESYDKRLLIEMDTSLVQGSQIEVTYEVKAKNLNEVDYDYGEKSDYEMSSSSSTNTEEIYANITKGISDRYITTSDYANYYYYGNSQGLNEMKATIEFIDYLKDDLIYKDDEIDDEWDDEETATQLFNDGYISVDAKNAVEDEYYILRTKQKVTLARGETETRVMTANKVLAIKNENVFDNNIEIIEIDGKTAKTIDGKDEETGLPKPKKGTPGNYIPREGPDEIDDDKVDVIITPPTGITNNIIIYSIGALFVLIVIFVTVMFIKKKALSK